MHVYDILGRPGHLTCRFDSGYLSGGILGGLVYNFPVAQLGSIPTPLSRLGEVELFIDDED